MSNSKSGFTLMEIMVVIIVIAVLASVGSSMLTTLVNQSKTSATKAKIDALKKALLAYQADVGRMPHSGPDLKCSKCESAYNTATEDFLSYNDEDKNVLLSPEPLSKFPKLKKRWKGPYMDTEPSDFMFDAWLNPIHYVAKGKNLYLWSYGSGDSGEFLSDGDGSTPANDLADPGEVLKKLQEQDTYFDDVIVSVKRFKKTLK